MNVGKRHNLKRWIASQYSEQEQVNRSWPCLSSENIPAAMALTLLGETEMLVSPGDAITHDQYAPLDTALPPLYGDSNFIFTAQPDPLGDRYG